MKYPFLPRSYVVRAALICAAVFAVPTWAAGATGPACPLPPPSESATQNVAIIIDESAYRPAAFVEQLRARVGDLAEYGARVVVYRFAGESPLPAIVDDIVMPLPPGDESMSNWEPVTVTRAKQKCAKQALSVGRDRIQSAVATVARNLHDDDGGTSPILATLRQVTQSFGGRALRIILVSDGIEHSSVASLYASRVGSREPSELLNGAESSGFLAPAKRVTLQIAGLALQAPEQATVRPGANLAWLTRFWSQYGKRTGMTVTELSSTVPVSVR